jgi:hypothetical protein
MAHPILHPPNADCGWLDALSVSVAPHALVDELQGRKRPGSSSEPVKNDVMCPTWPERHPAPAGADRHTSMIGSRLMYARKPCSLSALEAASRGRTSEQAEDSASMELPGQLKQS